MYDKIHYNKKKKKKPFIRYLEKKKKGRREVISVNHWDGGRSGHYPPTACSLIDSRCYIVHAVWSHGLFGR